MRPREQIRLTGADSVNLNEKAAELKTTLGGYSVSINAVINSNTYCYCKIATGGLLGYDSRFLALTQGCFKRSFFLKNNAEELLGKNDGIFATGFVLDYSGLTA